TRLLSSPGFAAVALALIVTACMCAVLVVTTQLLAVLDPHPAWIATAVQEAVTVLIALAGAGFAAFAGTRFSAVARKKSRERLRTRNRELFSQIDAIVDQVLDARR
ncbi:MAG TPA: hypothetical protein VF771_02505, partial [Longimicrobiaceae bacterium]